MSDLLTTHHSLRATPSFTGVPCPWCGCPTWRVQLRTRGVLATCGACSRQVFATPGPVPDPFEGRIDRLADALVEYAIEAVAHLAACGVPPATRRQIAAVADGLAPLTAAAYAEWEVLFRAGWQRGQPLAAQPPAAQAASHLLAAMRAAWLGPVLAPDLSINPNAGLRTPSHPEIGR